MTDLAAYMAMILNIMKIKRIAPLNIDKENNAFQIKSKDFDAICDVLRKSGALCTARQSGTAARFRKGDTSIRVGGWITNKDDTMNVVIKHWEDSVKIPPAKKVRDSLKQTFTG